jgi:hypothetical protein
MAGISVHTPTASDRAYSLALRFYAASFPEGTEEFGQGVETIGAFIDEHGRSPRSALEVDAWCESESAFAEFLKANPVEPTVQSKPAPKPPVRTPSVSVQPVMTAGQLANLSRKALGEMFKSRFGFAMPQGWNRVDGANAYMGTAFKAGTNGKKCAQWHYTNKAGVSPAKSWTVKKLTAEVAKDVPALPRSKGSKAEATARYIDATGYLPAKSWTIAQIVANTDAKKLPARNAVKA